MRLVLGCLVLVIACTKPNPNRCCTDEADCTAKGIPIGNTCGEGLLCRGNQCIAQPCTAGTQCDPAAPYCVAEACAEACDDDSQCPGFGQTDVPFCESGACVECRDAADCTAAAPVCDGGACRTCEAHSDCPSDLCDHDAGTCIDEATIVYVVPAGSTTSSCTRGDPCAIARALEVVDTARPNIKLAAGSHVGSTGTYRKVSINFFGDGEAGTTIDGLYLLGARAYRFRDLTVDDSLSVASQTSTEPLATLDASRVTFRGAFSGGLSLTRCRATLVDVRVGGHADYCSIILLGAAGFEGSELIMDRSEISNAYCGVKLDDASKLQIANSVFRDLGVMGAIYLIGPDVLPSSISFSTFYNTHWACPDGTVLFASRNNLFLNEKAGAPANTVTGTQCTHSYDMIKPQSAAPTGSNNVLGADPQFVNKAAGDFHLMATSPAIDTADPSATEATDFDGTARPQGAKRDIGAFEYKP